MLQSLEVNPQTNQMYIYDKLEMTMPVRVRALIEASELCFHNSHHGLSNKSLAFKLFISQSSRNQLKVSFSSNLFQERHSLITLIIHNDRLTIQ